MRAVIIRIVKDIMEILSDVATTKQIRKNSIMLCQGDTPHHVSLVRSGCVRVYRISTNGNEHIAGFKTAGDIFPECWVFGHSTNTMYCYETTEDSEILAINRDAFLDVLDRYPDQKDKCFNYMVKNYTGLMIHLSALGQSYAIDKILMILYYMMVRHGVERKPGEFWVLMKLRQSTIAGLTGLTRETVTAEMGKLKRQGIVNYDLGNFIIYRDALRDRLGEEAFLEIQFLA